MFRHIRSVLKCNLVQTHQLSSTKSKSNTTNLTLLLSRTFHNSLKSPQKLYLDNENEYAYKFLPQLPPIELSWQPQNKITTLEQLENLLDQNWRLSTASAIVATFETVKDVAISHKIPLSDRRFDNLIDGLMDHCEKLTDEELLKLLLLLLEYPPCESSTSHNFHDVWSCLDDICCWKMGAWSMEKLYVFADVWYKLRLGRLSDFIFEVLDKASKRADKLPKALLLYTFFYLNVSRRKDVAFEIEHALEQRIGEFDVNELGVIAMGYFKTKTKVKLKGIISAMVREISANCDTIDEITLTALLKAIRLSQNVDTALDLLPMLDKLTLQIPRLSNMALVHLSLLGTSLQLKHESSLRKCTERIVNDVENARLKDIERMLLVCSMFNMDTHLYQKGFEEIQKDRRLPEVLKYSRCLPSVLHYLSLRQIYSPQHLNQLLDEEYINETFGKNPKNLPRELFSLDTSIEIECPDYKGNRLSPNKRYKAAKWLSEYTPTHNQHKRLTLADKYYLDVADHVKVVVGGENFLRHDHVLPHFSKSDIVVVKDRGSGVFVEPFGFDRYFLGDVKRPAEGDKYKWFAIVVLTPNLMVRNVVEPLGSMFMKRRQLRRVGYEPVFVYWNEFLKLSPPEKFELISSRLS